MIHGKLRDGDTVSASLEPLVLLLADVAVQYWSTMDGILTSALQDNVAGVSNNSIIVAPQFFSTVLNSGQYTLDQLAWGDINAWQAGSVATHPSSTTLTSFDALDAIVAQLANQSTYPSLTNITVIGHGGGGQLNQRYSMLAQVSCIASTNKKRGELIHVYNRTHRQMFTSDIFTVIHHHVPTLPKIDLKAYQIQLPCHPFHPATCTTLGDMDLTTLLERLRV